MSDYKYILIPVLTIFIAQVLKVIIELISTGKFSVKRLFNGSGGMPSTHTSAVVSIITIIGVDFGFNSPLFAICMIFGVIVMYDAMGIRYESGKQAEIINKLAKDSKFKDKFEDLKEQLGHKPIEVLGGILTGIIITILLNSLFV